MNGIDFDRGQVWIAGHDTWAEPVAVRRLLGVVPDPLHLFDRLTARELLGHLGEDAEISWSVDGGAVRLRIEASTPGLLPAAWAAGSLRRIDRTFVVRIEELR